MFCPNCHSEYREGFTRCSDCDIALIQELPRKAKDIDLVSVFETNDPALADVVTAVLRAKPIEFIVRDSGPTAIVRGIPIPVQFWVAEGDESAARECIRRIVASDVDETALDSGEETNGLHVRVTRYSRKTGRSSNEEIEEPTWEKLEREIRTMDPFEKPIIFITTAEDDTESDCMAITGGDGMYHLQISDANAEWHEAVNLSRGDTEIEVWTSDQGFTTAERFTWSTEDALRIAKFFWQEQKPSPDTKWS